MTTKENATCIALSEQSMYRRLALVETIDGLCVQFHGVAGAESRRDPFDPFPRPVVSVQQTKSVPAPRSAPCLRSFGVHCV
ncbi:hypothetical protein Y032_0502g2617 [Ancylostoma ceylanicum]|uniref:Uncharacterized protein n=1 Tax=Ancylostoma ceylanicum TaxID=53326 RepID=A0A016WU58_9BILA|nr:hypothetical protein Y032_0502g2617 [Ancylostoma ceylanicum]